MFSRLDQQLDRQQTQYGLQISGLSSLASMISCDAVAARSNKGIINGFSWYARTLHHSGGSNHFREAHGALGNRKHILIIQQHGRPHNRPNRGGDGSEELWWAARKGRQAAGFPLRGNAVGGSRGEDGEG